jgi:hypothetical protein
MNFTQLPNLFVHINFHEVQKNEPLAVRRARKRHETHPQRQRLKTAAAKQGGSKAKP